MNNTSLQKRIQKIKLLALDADGVLTDGRIIYDSRGTEIKNFDVRDGFSLVLFQQAGFKTAILTARFSKVVSLRAQDLKVNKLYQNAYPKREAYQKLLKHFHLKDEEVCFVGDDLPDLSVLKRVGFAVAVKDAVPEIKKAAHYVTRKKGGRGAVREVVELILKTQNMWKSIMARFDHE